MSKYSALLGSAAVATALLIGVGFVIFAPASECGNGGAIAGGKAAIGGPFTMVNHKGITVTDKDVITGPTLVYFGYTFCPDVCPLDTARNAEVVDLLKDDGYSVTPVFITIDPARDTVSELADYVEVMHPDMIGLTGTDEQVATASMAYKTYYKKMGDGDDYVMDHTAFTYLMGPDGLWEYFRRDVPASDMAEVIACNIDNR